MGHLSILLDRYLDTIGKFLWSYRRKSRIVATNGENHQSAKLIKLLYSDLVATSVGAIAGTSNVTTLCWVSHVRAGGRTGRQPCSSQLFPAVVSSILVPFLLLYLQQRQHWFWLSLGSWCWVALENIHWDDMAEAVPSFLHFNLYGDSAIPSQMGLQQVLLLIQ